MNGPAHPKDESYREKPIITIPVWLWIGLPLTLGIIAVIVAAWVFGG